MRFISADPRQSGESAQSRGRNHHAPPAARKVRFSARRRRRTRGQETNRRRPARAEAHSRVAETQPFSFMWESRLVHRISGAKRETVPPGRWASGWATRSRSKGDTTLSGKPDGGCPLGPTPSPIPVTSVASPRTATAHPARRVMFPVAPPPIWMPPVWIRTFLPGRADPGQPSQRVPGHADAADGSVRAVAARAQHHSSNPGRGNGRLLRAGSSRMDTQRARMRRTAVPVSARFPATGRVRRTEGQSATTGQDTYAYLSRHRCFGARIFLPRIKHLAGTELYH